MITQRSIIKGVVARWFAQYPDDKGYDGDGKPIGARLKNLDLDKAILSLAYPASPAGKGA